MVATRQLRRAAHRGLCSATLAPGDVTDLRAALAVWVTCSVGSVYGGVAKRFEPQHKLRENLRLALAAIDRLAWVVTHVEQAGVVGAVCPGTLNLLAGKPGSRVERRRRARDRPWLRLGPQRQDVTVGGWVGRPDSSEPAVGAAVRGGSCAASLGPCHPGPEHDLPVADPQRIAYAVGAAHGVGLMQHLGPRRDADGPGHDVVVEILPIAQLEGWLVGLVHHVKPRRGLFPFAADVGSSAGSSVGSSAVRAREGAERLLSLLTTHRIREDGGKQVGEVDKAVKRGPVSGGCDGPAGDDPDPADPAV